MVQLLLRHTADANICMSDEAGHLFVALHISSQGGHENVEQLMLDSGAQVNTCYKHSSNPLYVACFWGYCSIAQLLLNKGTYINQCMDDRSSSLHASCFVGNDSIVQYLLEKTALVWMYAIMMDSGFSIELNKMDESENTVKRLLDNNASVNLCTKISV